jgi:hypothetical protein
LESILQGIEIHGFFRLIPRNFGMNLGISPDRRRCIGGIESKH